MAQLKAKSRQHAPEQQQDNGSTSSSATQGNLAAQAALSAAASSSGRPLDNASKAALGGLAGDTENVRIHSDQAAADAANAVNANAFASGNDIYFAQDKFQPGTAAGDKLMVEEVVHTMQNTGSGGVSDPNGGLERQAGQVADRAASGDMDGAAKALGGTGGGDGAGGNGNHAVGNMIMRNPVSDELNYCPVDGPSTEATPDSSSVSTESTTTSADADASAKKDADPANKKEPEWATKPKLSFEVAGKPVSVELQDGVGVEVDFSGWKLPKEDFKKSKVETVPLTPSAGIRFELAMGGGVGAGGKVKFTGKKSGEGENTTWGVDVSSTAYAKSEFWGEIAIGGFLGVKGANISASFYAKPQLVAEASIGIEGGVTLKNGQWGGRLAFPFDLKGAASAEVGVKANWEFLFWDGEFGRFSFGEWIIATGGMASKPETTWPGPVDTSTAVAPHFNWGDTPKPKKMGSSDKPTTPGFTYFGGGGNNTAPPPTTGGGGGKGYCFPAGTLVHTADGLRPIESLAEGSEVVTRDPETGARTTAVVEALDQHAGDFDMLHFGVGADRIVTTGGHRFLTAEAYWSRADDLQPGQALQTGTVAHVPVPMKLVDTVIYNLRVRGERSYLVGHSGLLVRDH